MRAAVRELVERPGVILSDDAPPELVEWVDGLVSGLRGTKATDDEAIALLELISRSDRDMYGLNWSIVHFIETAPAWPIWPALMQTTGQWARELKIRLRNAGLVPPAVTLGHEGTVL